MQRFVVLGVVVLAVAGAVTASSTARAGARRPPPRLSALFRTQTRCSGLSHARASTTSGRAQALDPDGSLVDDFRIRRIGVVTAVRNAPSPGATSSMAIAEHVAGKVLED